MAGKRTPKDSPARAVNAEKKSTLLPIDEWTIQRTDTNAVALKARFNASTRHKILLLSDLHWDSAHCRLSELKSTMDKALKDNSPVFIFGDLFDAMQGKWDPRSSQTVLRPEHRGGNYLDLLVDTAVEWFKPYKSVLALVTYGNHETAILKRHEVDLIQRFVGAMRSLGSPVIAGPYWGFCLIQGLFKKSNNSADVVKRLAWHHGYGGGGEITRGLIDSSRTRSQYDADIYVSGHIHRRNVDENVVTRVSSRGLVYTQPQLFVRCSCWKDETDGYHVEKGRAARPIGGWWAELVPNRPVSTASLDLMIRMTHT